MSKNTTPTTARPEIVGAITLVHSNRAQEAADRLSVLAQQTPPDADAYFLLGVMLLLSAQKEKGLELVRQARKVGQLSQDIFFYLSELLEPFGANGETIRLALQRERLMPLLHTGVMSPAATRKGDLTQIEPWHFSRRMTSFFPPKQQLFQGDHQKLVQEYVLKGWLPENAPFKPSSKILTMGSCFAEELRNYLREKGLWSDVMFVPPGLNNTFALRNFIEWCITGSASSDAYWYDESETGMAVRWAPTDEQARYLDVFRSIDGLVLTVGLAEVWEDTSTGGVFWRGVPKSIFDDEKHVCRLSTVTENLRNLQKIIELVRTVNPTAQIVVTLSPVPLKATNQPFSCISADSISKSVLRLAIHELTILDMPDVHYWPSFEIVRWLGSHLDQPLFGEDGNTRHVNRSAVKLILDNFISAYFTKS